MTALMADEVTRVVDPPIPGTSHRHVYLNGRRYHLIYGESSTKQCLGTVFLIHGFQDLSFGWRYQIPMLLDQGFRVAAIDCIGYGGTDAPSVPPASIENYTFKRTADDIKELARQLQVVKVVLGGHDWGGLIATRVFLYYPSLVAGIFSAGTPYLPPESQWLESPQYFEKYPTFRYQKHFGGPEFESNIKTKEDIRLFFIAGYYGRGPNGELPFSTEGALMQNWPLLVKSDVLTDEELDYYTQEYARHGMHAPLNWYRNRRQNFEDEVQLDPHTKITVPFLFIQSLKDPFLPPQMSEGMEDRIPRLRRREVDAGHFSLVLVPGEINRHVEEWLQEEVLPSMSN